MFFFFFFVSLLIQIAKSELYFQCVDFEEGTFTYNFEKALIEAETAPVIVIIGPGPGVPGVYSYFHGFGPHTFNDKFNNNRNPNSWKQRYNLVFVNSRLLIGFFQEIKVQLSPYKPYSYFDSIEVIDKFLRYIFVKHDLVANDIFFYGEDYGGTIAQLYVWIIHRTLMQNPENLPFWYRRVKGLILSGAIFDYTNQFRLSGYLKHVFKGDFKTFYDILEKSENYLSIIKDSPYYTPGLTQNYLNLLRDVSNKFGVNPFNFNKDCGRNLQCLYYKKFNVNMLVESLVDISFEGCKNPTKAPFSYFNFDTYTDYPFNFEDENIESQLFVKHFDNIDFPVLYIHGYYDMYVNFYSSYSSLSSLLNFKFDSEFLESCKPKEKSKMATEPLCSYQISRFSRFEVLDGGHLLAEDNGAALLKTVSNFINSLTFFEIN